MTPKRLFLYTLIGSVAVSAVIGIFVVLLGNFGRLEIQILMSTLTVTVTSILGLACGAYYETGRGSLLPKVGIVITLAAAVMTFLIIWDVADESKIFVQAATSMMLLAFATSHLCLLSIARLEKRFAWARPAAYVAIGALSAVLLYLIWTEAADNSEAIMRLVGVLSILVASVTVVTPVLHKLSEKRLDIESLDAEIDALRQRIGELEAKRDAIQNS